MLDSLDELYEMRSQQSLYPGYTEEPIRFTPTYKCEFQENNLKFINKKDQCPSFTDRILFKQNDFTSSVAHTRYDSILDILGSDHRPVYLCSSLKPSLHDYIDASML